ncbi:MAG: acyltransferase [Candidatus Omnitrophica bacterium]|nr:acyltransferase [Candidatus Omnitrophota bacterium]
MTNNARVTRTPLLEPQTIPIKEDRLPFLDGLRGLAAVWVIIAHSLDLSSHDIKYLSRGDIAVDLFMILSGFLMAYHYYLREDREPWGAPKTWFKFYVRRFFRIAPLYYFLLVAFFAWGPAMAQWRLQLAEIFPETYTDPFRFLDYSWQNILAHFTFVYGLFKSYAVRTTMPDWSITLEMQFYWAFPFLMLLFRRYYFVVSTIGLYFVCHKINAFLYHDGYQKPTVLPMGLHFFLMGMLLALFNRYRSDRLKAVIALGLAFWLAWLTQERFVLLIVVVMTALLNPSTIGKPLAGVSKMLSSRLATWLADMSYPAYLLHMGVMMPLAYGCSRYQMFNSLPGILRFLILFALTTTVTYLFSAFLHERIEKRGIIWGKRIVEGL